MSMRSLRRSTRSTIRPGSGRSASGMERLSDHKMRVMFKRVLVLVVLSVAGLLVFGQVSAQAVAPVSQAVAVPPPSADINNGIIHARLYLPDTAVGYYRATRFDWAGGMPVLEYKGHQFITH